MLREVSFLLTPSWFSGLSLSQPAADTRSEGSSGYCLLMEQAAVSVVTPGSVHPIGV